MEAQLKINEIYKSIQGESTWAGLACILIRFTGCHLRCSYCDSPHAFYEGRWMTVTTILDEVQKLGGKLVEITGGEPLLQPACRQLAQALLDRGYTVLCETSGALPIDRLPVGVIRIMDLKCPSSNESHQNDWTNIDKLQPQDQVKFVIGNRSDYDWSAAVLKKFNLAHRCEVLFSPVFGEIEPRQMVEWILADQLPVRFQLQLHKFIWEPHALGV